MANDTEKQINESIAETSSPEQRQALAAPVEQPTSIYKLPEGSKVPVSRYEGPVWNARKTGGLKRMSWLFDAWGEAERYYSAGQMEHRRVTGGQYKGNDVTSKNRNRKFSSTDNQVYATVNAVLPSIYAKNPNVEISMTEEDADELKNGLQHFCNNIIVRKDAPGINLKTKVRKSIIRCEVTNEAWLMVGYTMREDSADAAVGDIQRIGKELLAAKDEKEIRKLEGELMALEEACDMLNPAGPFVTTLRGDQVIVDDASVDDDHTDANWMMVGIKFSTNYLNARYRRESKDGEFVSVYKPTHIVDSTTDQSGVSETQREIDAFHIFQEGKDNPQSYGYSDLRTYDRAKFTLCWYCFDKVKRRFYLYADNDWTWPIWVFDDPYHLPTFFPLFKLQYHSDPKLNRTKGEVSHYLDQQDDLNTIADELNRARTAVRDRALFDSTSLSQKQVEEIMLSTDRMLIGLALPEGKKLSDLIAPPPLPGLEFQHLWDKTPIMQSINQISGVGEAMRGEQFKTNTTNKAIDFYTSNSGVRLDEKRDAVEDLVGDVIWAVLFLCLQFMDRQQMAKIAGSKYGDALISLPLKTAEDIRNNLLCRVIGGSTQKPTSAAKKAEALQIGQVLGQFAGGAPYAAVLAVKAFAKSFDGFVVTAADWRALLQTMMMAAQQGGPAQGAEEEAPPEEEEGEDEDAIAQEVVARARAQGKTVTPMQAKHAVQRKTATRPN